MTIDRESGLAADGAAPETEAEPAAETITTEPVTEPDPGIETPETMTTEPVSKPDPGLETGETETTAKPEPTSRRRRAGGRGKGRHRLPEETVPR